MCIPIKFSKPQSCPIFAQTEQTLDSNLPLNSIQHWVVGILSRNSLHMKIVYIYANTNDSNIVKALRTPRQSVTEMRRDVSNVSHMQTRMYVQICIRTIPTSSASSSTSIILSHPPNKLATQQLDNQPYQMRAVSETNLSGRRYQRQAQEYYSTAIIETGQNVALATYMYLDCGRNISDTVDGLMKQI